jgi:hypothetical protein
MKEIRLPLNFFDLEGLLKQTIDFLKEQVSPEADPSFAMVWVENPGDVPTFGPQAGYDVLAAIQGGKHVFFPFAVYYDDLIVTCADGENYALELDEESDESECFIDMKDAVGYLIQVQDDYVIIDPAIHAGGGSIAPPPSVDLCEDLGPLKKPMAEYIAQFIKQA